MDLWEGFLKMASALTIVLALLLLTAAAARRWVAKGFAGKDAGHPIRLVGSLSLGGRRAVLVLAAAGRTLVVGATAQNLVLLTEFETAAGDGGGVLTARSVRDTADTVALGPWADEASRGEAQLAGIPQAKELT